MAKKKKQSELTILKSTAQTFTVSAAVLYGVLWLVTMIYDLKSDGLDALGGSLITATVVGGIIMGMIHFADFFKSK